MTREEKERIMESVCDEVCHWPFVCMAQETLDERCRACPVEKVIDGLMEENRITVQVENVYLSLPEPEKIGVKLSDMIEAMMKKPRVEGEKLHTPTREGASDA